MRLLIYGSGGLGSEFMDIARRVDAVEKRWQAINFIDDYNDGIQRYGSICISFEAVCNRYSPEDVEIVIAVGDPVNRKLLREKITENGFCLASALIDPLAYVSPTVIFGAGVVIAAMSIVSSSAVLSDNTYLNLRSLVGHHCKIGKDTIISISSSMSGGCTVGSQSYIANGVLMRDRITIGSNTIIGMGSVVVKDIPDNVVAMGNPCEVKRQNTTGKVFS